MCAARYFGREVIRRRPPWGRGPSQGPPKSLGNGWRPISKKSHFGQPSICRSDQKWPGLIPLSLWLSRLRIISCRKNSSESELSQSRRIQSQIRDESEQSLLQASHPCLLGLALKTAASPQPTALTQDPGLSPHTYGAGAAATVGAAPHVRPRILRRGYLPRPWPQAAVAHSANQFSAGAFPNV